MDLFFLLMFLEAPVLQMGVIGDAFGKLFGFLGDLFEKFFSYLGALWAKLLDFLKDLFTNLFSLIWEAIKWIGNLIKLLFQGLIDFLSIFFEAIFGLIAGLLHLLYMIGVLAVKLFLVIFEAAKLLWSLAVGFGNSLASLKYTPSSSGGHGYSSMMGKIFEVAAPLQVDIFAYILLFCLWFVTAISALKLISSIRVGGE